MTKLGYIEVYNHPLTVSLRENFNTILSEYINLSSKFLGIKPNNLMGSAINQEESNGQILYQGKINSVFTVSTQKYTTQWIITQLFIETG